MFIISIGIGGLFDLLMLANTAIWLVGLVFRGAIDWLQAIVALIVLTIWAAAGRAARSGLVRLTFRLALPAANLAAFLALFAPERGMALASTLGGLLVMIVVVYWLARMILKM